MQVEQAPGSVPTDARDQTVTQLRRAEQQLAEAEEKYRALVERAVEGVFRTTPDGRFLMANQALARMLGFDTPEQLIAERHDIETRQYVRPEERAHFKQLLDLQGVVQGFEYEAYRRDGTTIWLRDHVRVVRDTQGVILYYEGTVEDVTARRRADDVREHLLARAISAQEEERGRVARELHDETGQALTAILVGLRNLEAAVSGTAALRQVADLRHLVESTIRDVGRIARGLRPAVLDDLGLIPALQRYAEDLHAARGLTIEIRGPETERFPHAVETTLYRIIQEALTNVGAHARARAAHVDIQRRAGAVLAVVRDDGDGFDVASAVEVNGRRQTLGLIGMQERASLVGGSVVIDSRPGTGTKITVILPVP